MMNNANFIVKKSPSFRRSLLALTLASAFAFVPTVLAQAPATGAGQATTTENGDNVSLNFNSADIETVIRAIGKISGKNFLVDPRVKGTLNIVTNEPVPRAMTYQILLSALRLQGYAAVEDRGVTKIVPEADAKLSAVPVGKNDKAASSGDKIVTQVFQIQHESAAQLVQVVRPLVSPNNVVTVYPGNNSLVVTDYAGNIARIGQIIKSIDVPQGDSLLIPIRHASAIDLANTLTKLYSEGAQGSDASQRVTILSDARSNALLVRSENRSKLQAVRSMASQMDVQGTAGNNLRVIYLKNADASKVAETLRAALSGNAPTVINQSTRSTSNNTSSSGNTNGATPTFNINTGGTPANTATAASTGASGNNIANYVFADMANNALVVTAPDSVYNNIREVINQLDRRPAQVYVEALIAEVNAERAAEIGIQWQAGVPTGNKTTVFGGTNFGSDGDNILQLATNPAKAGAGLNFLVGSGPVTIMGQQILNLNLLARFLEQDNSVNILSTPSLVTIDNEEAKIVVGKNLPFLTGQYTNTGSNGSVNPFQTIERKDVGLTLKIKPQITEGGTIRLQIYQEASNVLDSSAAGPITSTRSLETNVITDDGTIIALGGLIEDSYTGGVDKIPFLGDLPLIGALFRYDNRKHSKTNLLIFLRPKILRTAEDTREISQDRYDYIIGKQREAGPVRDTMRIGQKPAGPQMPIPPRANENASMIRPDPQPQESEPMLKVDTTAPLARE